MAGEEERMSDQTMKRCYVCKIEKPLSEFGKKATNKDGLQAICKACQKIERKQYYEANKEKEFENHRKYEVAHRGELNAYRARQRASDPDYYLRAHEYVKRRKQTSIEYLIAHRSRFRIERALTVAGTKASSRVLDLLGCSIEDFKEHLESTFQPGMSWDVYRAGEMQIDHIIPCSCFDLSRPDHQRACFNFRNTRMLFRAENVGRKANRFPTAEELEAFVRSVA